MKRSISLLSVVTASAILVAGCGDTQQEDGIVLDTPPAAETPQATPQPGMQAQGDQFQARLVGHVSRARAADAQGFRQMWPEHQGLVNEMLEDCRQMMRQMGMTPPRQFTQVEQALENDLRQIPGLADAELASFLPGHLDRVQTVIDMRQEMIDMR